MLLALYTRKVLGYDAWTSGTVLTPDGPGNLLSLVIAARLITRFDQRAAPLQLALPCDRECSGRLDLLVAGVVGGQHLYQEGAPRRLVLEAQAERERHARAGRAAPLDVALRQNG